MGQSGLNAAVARKRVSGGLPGPARRGVIKEQRLDLELKIAALQKNYAELHTAIFEAAQVHRHLCAPRLLRFQDFEIASEIFAVRHLPGDFFTVEETRGGVVMALGDISGKGLGAGMWTTHFVGLVRAHAARADGAAAIVSAVNRDVCRMSMVGPLASLFLARLDPAKGTLEYCSAGHPPAFVLRANGNLESLSEGGLLLGVLPDAVYVKGRVELQFGDVLVAYSDGVIESLNNMGEEFGYARAKNELRRAQNESAETILFSMLGAVQDFAGTRPLVDDMSLAVLRRATM